MAEFYIGMVFPVAFNFAPKGSLLCQGQILAIASNTALFSLLGTYYGGNGTSTFALPNLQGNIAIGSDQGPGLSPYTIGETGGVSSVTVLPTEMPSHPHSLNAAGGRGSTPSTSPANTFLSDAAAVYAPNTTKTDTNLTGTAVGLNGSTQPHNNMMPYVAINWCIVTNGLYPSFS